MLPENITYRLENENDDDDDSENTQQQQQTTTTTRTRVRKKRFPLLANSECSSRHVKQHFRDDKCDRLYRE